MTIQKCYEIACKNKIMKRKKNIQCKEIKWQGERIQDVVTYSKYSTDNWNTINILIYKFSFFWLLTNLSNSFQAFIRLFDKYNVVNWCNPDKPSKDDIWLYDNQSSSNVFATSSNFSIY